MKNNNKYHWMWKIHEIVDTIKPFDVYGQGTYCPDIYFFHTFKTKDKFWANIDYFKAHFEREKTNSTVSMRLLNYYIWYWERDSIVPLLKEIPYIHWRFINEFIKIWAALEKNKYYEEQKILNQLIKKSLVLSKRLGRSR